MGWGEALAGIGNILNSASNVVNQVGAVAQQGMNIYNQGRELYDAVRGKPQRSGGGGFGESIDWGTPYNYTPPKDPREIMMQEIAKDPELMQAIQEKGGLEVFMNDPALLGQIADVETRSRLENIRGNAYEQALANQQAAANQMQATSRNMIEQDAMLRQRILSQTGELGARLRAAYAQMGNVPMINQATVAADYGRLREQGQSDFNDLMAQLSSAQYTGNYSRMGGGRQLGLEQEQMRQNLEKYAPIQQRLDQEAYMNALDRASRQSSAFAGNRSDVYNTIISALRPQLESESQMYQPGVSGSYASSASGMAENLLRRYGSDQAQAAYDAEKAATAGAGILRQKYGIKPKQQPGQQEQAQADLQPPVPVVQQGQTYGSSLPPVFKDATFEPYDTPPLMDLPPSMPPDSWWETGGYTPIPGAQSKGNLFGRPKNYTKPREPSWLYKTAGYGDIFK